MGTTSSLSNYVMAFIGPRVRDVFMLPGDGSKHLNKSLGCCQRLNYACSLHEQAMIVTEVCAPIQSRMKSS
jgi:hypothetical protein